MNTDLRDTKKVSESKFLCKEICGRRFRSIDEHTEFVKSYGCAHILDALAGTRVAID